MVHCKRWYRDVIPKPRCVLYTFLIFLFAWFLSRKVIKQWHQDMIVLSVCSCTAWAAKRLLNSSSLNPITTMSSSAILLRVSSTTRWLYSRLRRVWIMKVTSPLSMKSLWPAFNLPPWPRSWQWQGCSQCQLDTTIIIITIIITTIIISSSRKAAANFDSTPTEFFYYWPTFCCDSQGHVVQGSMRVCYCPWKVRCLVTHKKTWTFWQGGFWSHSF